MAPPQSAQGGRSFAMVLRSRSRVVVLRRMSPQAWTAAQVAVVAREWELSVRGAAVKGTGHRNRHAAPSRGNNPVHPARVDAAVRGLVANPSGQNLIPPPTRANDERATGIASVGELGWAQVQRAAAMRPARVGRLTRAVVPILSDTFAAFGPPCTPGQANSDARGLVTHTQPPRRSSPGRGVRSSLPSGAVCARSGRPACRDDGGMRKPRRRVGFRGR